MPSKIRERQVPYEFIYTWNLKSKNKNKKQDNKFLYAANILVVGECKEFGMWEKWVKRVQRYKLPVIK